MQNADMMQLEQNYTQFCASVEENRTASLLNAILLIVRRLVRRRLLDLIRDSTGSFSYGDQALTEQDAEDLASDVVVKLLERLQQQKEGVQRPIENLAAFAHTLAYHAFAEAIRKRRPAWRRTQHRLLHMFKTDDSPFAVWEPEKTVKGQGRYSGYAVWQHSRSRLAPPLLRAMLRNQPFDVLDQGGYGAAECAQASPWDLLHWIYTILRGPSLFEELIWGFLHLRPPHGQLLHQEDRLPGNTDSSDVLEAIPDHTFNPIRILIREEELAMEISTNHDILHALWRCLASKTMLPHHAAAFLLGLGQRTQGRQGNLRLFAVLLDLTTEELAEAMELPASVLEEFWERLPLSDEEIGSLYDATPSRVADYRRAAKRKLEAVVERILTERRTF